MTDENTHEGRRIIITGISINGKGCGVLDDDRHVTENRRKTPKEREDNINTLTGR